MQKIKYVRTRNTIGLNKKSPTAGTSANTVLVRLIRLPLAPFHPLLNALFYDRDYALFHRWRFSLSTSYEVLSIVANVNRCIFCMRWVLTLLQPPTSSYGMHVSMSDIHISDWVKIEKLIVNIFVPISYFIFTLE